MDRAQFWRQFWRRRGDSNPRDPFEPNGFQDRRFQPLTHPSVFDFNPLRRLEGYLYPWSTVRLNRNAHRGRLAKYGALASTHVTNDSVIRLQFRDVLISFSS